MEKELNIIINDAFIAKLDSISQDIKTYVNINAGLSASDKEKVFPRMTQEDVTELLVIRRMIKNLSSRLKNTLPQQNN